MAKIILIETSTALCSVALEIDGKVVALREDSTRQHASMTAPFVKEVLDEQGLTVKDCDAVCVGKGPGSYTGLRVGASTAKGLCFGAGLPLIAVGSLDVLVAGAEADGFKYVVPMIDARRMEVFTNVFTPDGKALGEVRAEVVDEGSFAAQRAEGPVLFIGDGAGKCADILAGDGCRFVSCCPSAKNMAVLAENAWKERNFENTAYFEPFYLKDFVATIPRKKLF
ncbi:MAG: tRNA (adenosine(37)-N6)-threonylcarbamoyltransferase complex dimerization subunit type 1 TsaB [Bacteroidales bacterium]|nr:tRNA (adenosine(37)-N6)-threonylcarbamoyltransferase complex dimerization subunit type 1 TsaB [Bacteroidales bacterium]